MEIKGKLMKIMPEQTGSGKAGNWTKQEFVIETIDKYPKNICMSTWNDKTGTLGKCNVGDTLKVSFNLESREYNSKWYT